MLELHCNNLGHKAKFRQHGGQGKNNSPTLLQMQLSVFGSKEID
jgi:hypothetical protein